MASNLGDNGMVFRLLTLMTHYRQPLDFSERRMVEARRVLTRWAQVCVPTDDPAPLEVMQSMCNDLNTPAAIAAMHVYRNQGEGKKLFSAMKFLGLFDGRCTPDEWKTVPRDQLGNAEPGPQILTGPTQ